MSHSNFLSNPGVVSQSWILTGYQSGVPDVGTLSSLQVSYRAVVR